MLVSQTAAAKALGISRERLHRQCAKAGIEVKARQKLTFREVVRAMTGGNMEAEKLRETSARADLLELDRREKEKELVSLSDVQDMLQQMMAPIRSRLNAMPTELANRVNPTDPQLAKDAAQRWVDEAVKVIRKEGQKK